MADAQWKVEVLTVPSSTGNVAYTGYGGEPRALFFLGTNWLTEDSAVTSTGTGIFRGMATRQYDNLSAIVENVAFVSPAGDQHVTLDNCIHAHTTAGTGTALYAADVVSFDADGFTLNWWNAEAGGYKVVAIALMDVDNCAGFQGVTNQTGLAFGFKAEASLLHGAWGGPNIGGSDRTQEFYGGAAYPGSTSGDWMSAGMAAGCFPTSASQQYVNELTADAPSTRVATGMHFTGPSLVTSNITAVPTGGSLTDLTFNGDAADGGMIAAWNDCPSATGFPTIPDNEGDQFTESGLPFAPGLLIGYSISDEPSGQGTGGRGAAGLAVVTPDFQWCALIDGVSSRGSFQSFQRGFCDRVSGTSVHAGTIELTDNGFVMTAAEDDLDPGSFLWHAFGFPPQASWIPHIYRRVSG